MKVFLPGGARVPLRKSDFVGSGGEGDVYAVGGHAYKVFHDPQRVLPVGKMTELKEIQHPDVVVPETPIYNSKNRVIGYRMKWAGDTWVLCQLFPRSFRNRNGVKEETVRNLVQKLREMVQACHDAGVLVVDLNEMNYLVSKDFKRIIGIDADSYQTPSYPATAIMPSVQDPLIDYNKGQASEMSDWLSFAIVSFQMQIGIHPYKGKHPAVKGMVERMKAGISVLNKDVRIPRAAYPLGTIPRAYRDWYEQVLEHGKRLPPPLTLEGGTGILTMKPLSAMPDKQLEATILFDTAAPILRFTDLAGVPVAVLADGDVVVAATPVLSQGNMVPGKTQFLCQSEGYLGAAYTEQRVAVFVGDREAPNRNWAVVRTTVEQHMESDGRLYVKQGGGIFQVMVTVAGKGLFAHTHKVANCMERATDLYEGVAIQSMVGQTRATLFPRSEVSFTAVLKELDGYSKVVSAKASGRVLMLVAVKKGRYDRFVFRFNSTYSEYDVRIVKDVGSYSPNFVGLETGVVACINEEEELELFSHKRGNPGMRIVRSSLLGNDMTLTVFNGQVAAFRGTKVYRLRTK